MYLKDEIFLWKCIEQLLQNQIRLMAWTTKKTDLQQVAIKNTTDLREDCQLTIDALEAHL